MKMNFNQDETYRLSQPPKIGKIALGIGILGLLLTFLGYFTDRGQFFHSYLTGYIFWTTIGLGGLFFTLLHHLANATWSVVVRRLGESAMITLPIMFFLFIPVILGYHHLYEWSHTEEVAKDAILLKKAGYLNTPFFTIRTMIYFGVWLFLGLWLYRNSLRQDENGVAHLTEKMRRVSAPGMILFAVTLTFAAFDWLMSLEAHWYSTIFGVYIFGGCFLSILAFITLMAQYMRRQGILANIITVEHYNDLGKWLFAFTVFWGYIAFSQYFLIWYGNIPEETIWFQHRWVGSWKEMSLVLIFAHFVIPFFILMPRASKRNLGILASMATLILFAHWVDMYWIVMPGYHPQGVQFSWMDFTSLIGIGGIFVWHFWARLASHALIPPHDPKLQASLRFENV